MWSRWTRSLLACFARETSSGSFIPEIDGLRFIAILSVALFHADASQVVFRNARVGHELSRSLFSEILNQGSFGVQLFFAISAFVVGLPFARQLLLGAPRVRLRDYFLRRITRLEPPYLICLSVCFALAVTRWRQPVGDSIRHLLASMFYLHHVVYGRPWTFGYVFWSLEIEARFYLLAPLLAFIYGVRSKLLRRSILLGGIIGFGLLQSWLPGGSNPSDAQRWTLIYHLHYFLVGFLILDYYLTDWSVPSTMAFRWDVLATLAFAAMPLILLRHLGQHIVTPLLILVAYAGVFRGQRWRGIMRQPLVFTIGGMCYTIYMYHLMIIPSFEKLTLRIIHPSLPWTLNEIIQIVLLIPATLVLCAVVFLFTEKPFMRRDWPKRVWMWLGGSHLALAPMVGVPGREKPVGELRD